MNVKYTLTESIEMTPSEAVDLSKIKRELKRGLESREEVLVAYLYESSVKRSSREDSDIEVGPLLEDNYEPARRQI